MSPFCPGSRELGPRQGSWREAVAGGVGAGSREAAPLHVGPAQAWELKVAPTWCLRAGRGGQRTVRSVPFLPRWWEAGRSWLSSQLPALSSPARGWGGGRVASGRLKGQAGEGWGAATGREEWRGWDLRDPELSSSGPPPPSRGCEGGGDGGGGRGRGQEVG